MRLLKTTLAVVASTLLMTLVMAAFVDALELEATGSCEGCLVIPLVKPSVKG